VLTMARQVGVALGIAVMGAIIATQTGEIAGSTGTPEEFVKGFTLALRVSAGVAFGAALLALTTIRRLNHPPDLPGVRAAEASRDRDPIRPETAPELTSISGAAP